MTPATIRKVLFSPSTGDDETDRVARLLTGIVLILFITTLLAGAAIMVLHPDPTIALLYTAIAGTLLGILVLTRRRSVRHASVLLSGTLWVLVTVGAILFGGVESTAYGTYVIVLIVAGLLLGGRIAIGLAGLSTLAGLAMLYAENRGLLPAPLMPEPAVLKWAGAGLSFFIVALLLTLAFRSLNTALARSRRVERALQQSEAYFRSLVQHASDVITVLDQNGTILYKSPAIESVLGYRPDELMGVNLFNLIHPHDVDAVKGTFREVIKRPGITLSTEFRCRHKDESWRVLESTGTILAGPTNENRIVVNSRDITERRQIEEQLVHDAFHDALTDLPNRALFMDRLTQAIEQTRRHPEASFAVLFLDLDHFKMVNDRFGHAAGDELLVTIAERLTMSSRGVDTVARLGGDEFAILAMGTETSDDAERFVERLLSELERPFHVHEQKLVISVSVGIVLSRPDHNRPSDVLKDADIAMYRAKAPGQARYVIFEADMRESAITRLELETELQRAIEQEEFLLHYQPIILLQTGEITGFEVLIRWLHPQRGLTYPGAFLQTAEKTGLIVPLGEWVLRTACRQMRTWQEQYPHFTALWIGINLSNAQFTQPDLAERLKLILHETGCAAETIRLEIPECVIMQNTAMAGAQIERLRHLGLRLNMDNFGSAYASLQYLQQLPFSAVKVDQTLIRHLEMDESGQEIVHSLLAIARKLELTVIAKGVETEQQASYLKLQGCDWAQGYHFSRPIQAAEIEALLEFAQERADGQRLVSK